MAYNYPNSIGHGGKNRTHCSWLADAFCAKISYVKNNSFIVILPPPPLFARRPPAPSGRRPGGIPWGDRPPGGEPPPQGCRRGGAVPVPMPGSPAGHRPKAFYEIKSLVGRLVRLRVVLSLRSRQKALVGEFAVGLGARGAGRSRRMRKTSCKGDEWHSFQWVNKLIIINILRLVVRADAAPITRRAFDGIVWN